MIYGLWDWGIPSMVYYLWSEGLDDVVRTRRFCGEREEESKKCKRDKTNFIYTRSTRRSPRSTRRRTRGANKVYLHKEKYKRRELGELRPFREDTRGFGDNLVWDGSSSSPSQTINQWRKSRSCTSSPKGHSYSQAPLVLRRPGN